MGDIFAFIGALIILFAAGAVAYGAIRSALHGILDLNVRGHWFYFPLAILFTIIACRATMFCLDLINIYFVSSVIVFD